jgi:hypothetical protein
MTDGDVDHLDARLRRLNEIFIVIAVLFLTALVGYQALDRRQAVNHNQLVSNLGESVSCYAAMLEVRQASEILRARVTELERRGAGD